MLVRTVVIAWGAGLVVALPALAVTIAVRSSQGRPVKVTVDKERRLKSLSVRFSARCSDRHKHSFTITFDPPFLSQRGAEANGVINAFGGSFFGGPSYSEHASFSARLTKTKITGEAQATRSYDGGPSCNTGPVTFHAKL